MSLSSVNTYLPRATLWAVGVCCTAAGIAAMIAAGHGLASIDLFISGVRTSVGVELWVAVLAVNTMLVTAAMLSGQRLRAGTALVAVILGPMIAAALELMGDPSGAGAVIMVLCGAAGVGVGAALAISSNFGPSPYDMATLAIADRVGSLRTGRWILDAVLVAAGVVLGGVWGFGTAAAFAVIAVVLSVTHRLLRPVRTRLGTEPVQESASSTDAMTPAVSSEGAVTATTAEPVSTNVLGSDASTSG